MFSPYILDIVCLFVYMYLIFKISFQIPNKIVDLVPQLIEYTIKFWLGLLWGIIIAKTGLNIAKTGVL